MSKQIPAVSIIIPMYNVEKYIGECLDSILNQTFTDYEVIVVDDCSTDKSCEVVESYLPKFNRGVERLHLVRSEKNSGGNVGIPRNKAIRLSRGKYLFFMDSDDAIVDDALEILYKTAEKFNVDVVHCEKYFQAPDDTVTTDKNLLKENSDEKVEFVVEPTFMSDDIEDRVRDFGNHKIIGYPWNKLIRRDLIAEHNIEFPLLRCGEDHVFSFFVICLAKKILRIPNPLYVWRKSPEGVTYGKLPVEKMLHRWTDSLFRGIGIIDEFMNQFEVFNRKPEYRHLIFETFIYYHFGHAFPVYAQIPAHLLDPLIRRELSEVKDKTALTAFLFARMNLLNVQLIQAQNLLRQQPKEVQDFQRQNEIIQRQQAQIQQLQQQLRNVHDVFR